jgi:serine/threonine-protein kinase
MRRPGSIAPAVALAVAVATSAQAQTPSSGDKVAAEALFDEGRKLVTAGRLAEACPKFADSQRLDPSTGTLLNLASCWEKLGKTASAWATYREAASAASAAGRKDYVATAERHAEALAPRLARLTIEVPSPVQAIQVMRDGAQLPRPEWGVAVPVDPGPHTVEATAPGYKRWTTTVELTQEGVTAAVKVPPLEGAPPEAASTAAAPSAAPSGSMGAPPPSPSGQQEPSPAGGTQRTIGVVLAGAGVVGLAVSAGFAASAKSKYNDSLSHCETVNHDLCDPSGIATRNDARSAGNVATVALGIGGAALVAGAVLWLTAPRGGVAVGVAPAPGGAVVKGVW